MFPYVICVLSFAYVHLNNFGIWKTKHREEITEGSGFGSPELTLKLIEENGFLETDSVSLLVISGLSQNAKHFSAELCV